MPEGDSIHNLALRLAPILVHREVTSFTAHRVSDNAARSVVGTRITEVVARGKNLLVRFDDGRSLHIHLRMEGRIFVERPRSAFWAPSTRTRPEMRLSVDGGAAIVGKRLPVCRLLSASQEKRAPDLAGLGPDLLGEAFDENEALARLRDLCGTRSIAEALLVQRAVAGIGNVYKSEVLFLESVDPRARVSSIADDKLRALVRRARILLLRNVTRDQRRGPRTTRPTLSRTRLWVYGRTGCPCLRCGSAIISFHQGATARRSTYACPTCQCQPADKAV